MKINKKILIPVLGTAMGLSVIGGISGAVAWYQYNSKVTSSFTGASVADTGILQIGHKEGNNIVWGRDYVQPKSNLRPVTFGQLADGAIPGTAYGYPHSGAGEGYTGYTTSRNKQIEGWDVATNGEDYVQFELYFRAQQTDKTSETGLKQVERDVFLSDYIFKSVTDNKVADDALRVMLTVENGDNDYSILLSKSSHKVADDTALDLYGGLDLDNNGHADKYHATVFNDNLAAYGNHANDRQGTHDYDGDSETPETAIAGQPYWDGEEIVYGNYGEIQESDAIADRVQERINGLMPISGEGYAKKLFTTPETGELKVTVTIWLEGWEVLKTGANSEAVEWNAYYSAGTDVQVGLEFDSGIFRGEDLNQ